MTEIKLSYEKRFIDINIPKERLEGILESKAHELIELGVCVAMERKAVLSHP